MGTHPEGAEHQRSTDVAVRSAPQRPDSPWGPPWCRQPHTPAVAAAAAAARLRAPLAPRPKLPPPPPALAAAAAAPTFPRWGAVAACALGSGGSLRVQRARCLSASLLLHRGHNCTSQAPGRPRQHYSSFCAAACSQQRCLKPCPATSGWLPAGKAHSVTGPPRQHRSLPAAPTHNQAGPHIHQTNVASSFRSCLAVSAAALLLVTGRP